MRPLSRQRENGVVVVGRGEQYLELPAAGLDFLGWLEAGLTVGEARARFEARHNPFPDDELFAVLQSFLECDFVAAVDGRRLAVRHAAPAPQASWLRRAWAQALFSRPLLVGWMGVVAPAAGLLLFTPALWPRRTDYFWLEHNFVIILVGLLLWLFHMGVHELFHWLAARAKGVTATVSWTQRLGLIPLSETVLHDIWAVGRGARLLPLAAGLMWDLLRLSGAVYVLWLGQVGLLGLPLLVERFLKFYLLTAALGVAAQFWLFSQMDGYFLLSALLGQRNLQADTYAWLRSWVRRGARCEPPAGGWKYVYVYALVSLGWGGLFLGQFLLVNVPIQLQLFWESLLKVGGGAAGTLEFADGVAVLASQGIYVGLLAYVYWRDRLRGRRRR